MTARAEIGTPSHATIRHLKFITGSLIGLVMGWMWLPGNLPLLPPMK
jgi:hypothetical protein